MKFLTFITVAMFATVSFSQDIIKFKKGNVVEAKVVEVNDKQISYRLPSKDGDGPLYSIAIGKIDQVQYANGVIDNFEIIIEEHADLAKGHLIEFNAADLAFQRVNFNYELFPTKKRNFSIVVPIKFTVNHNSASHSWSNSPWFESGLGANLYVVRSKKSNLSVGLEASYAYKEVDDYIYDPWTWNPIKVEEKRHSMGFYFTSNYKYNFLPRLGMNVGFGLGWTYGMNHHRDVAQGKVDLGIFYRF